MKSRILIVFTGLILLWGLLLLRAGSLQILPSARLRSLQERQFQTVVTLQSRRGAIIDRKGRDLALSTRAYSIFADPKILEKRKSLSKKLAQALGIPWDGVYAKIKDGEKRFVWIARQLPKEKAEIIKSWDLRGLSIIEEFKRVYPNENLLAQTLGFVGSEGQGLEGLELQYDQALRGSKKKVSVRRDARGRPLSVNGLMFADDPDGAEVRLTVDSEMQHMLENELVQAVTDFQAEQAFGIVLDAQTSAILALANTPQFDANHAGKTPAEIRRNRIITDSFEPGSTMKTFAIAQALHSKIVAPNTKYNTENGIMKVADHFIREAETNHKWSQLTVSEILAYSSNIGATKIAFDLGADSLRAGLVDFGFGTKSGVDMPGEAKGILAGTPWNQHLLSNISFGQGVSVTPLQIANAYAAIANGGTLNTPFIVQSISDPDTGEEQIFKTKPIRRILTPQEAEQMRMMLLGATAPGATGVNANVEGFLVAGKTGTAQKADPNGRGYLANAYISSFAGFFPANDPKYVVYIAVDYPHKVSYYGATVAAPVFSRVASYVARVDGLAPVLLSEKNLVNGPRAKMKKIAIARNPTTEAPIEKKEATYGLAPDLRGRTIREVLKFAGEQDLDLKIIGTGAVTETIPAAGEEIGTTKKMTVIFK